MFGIMSVRAFVAWLFLVQMKIESGRFGVLRNHAIGVKFWIRAAS